MKNLHTLLFLGMGVFTLTLVLCSIVPNTVCKVSNAMAASIATADVVGGYAGTVLEKISSVWQPHPVPQGTTERKIRIRVHIDGSGFPEQCEIVTSSGLPAMDNGVCSAVQKAAPFTTPPYAVPIVIHMTFWSGQGSQSGQATQNRQSGQGSMGQDLPPSPLPKVTETDIPLAQDTYLPTESSISSSPPTHMSSPALGQGTSTPQAMQVNYVNEVMQQISPLVLFPSNLPRGTYSVTIAVQVDPQGQLLSTTLRESCGNDQLDSAVVQAALKKGHVTPPPGGQLQYLRLTFVVQKP